MKASQLIDALQKAIAEGGDREVRYEDDGLAEPADRVVLDIVDSEPIIWIV